MLPTPVDTPFHPASVFPVRLFTTYTLRALSIFCLTEAKYLLIFLGFVWQCRGTYRYRFRACAFGHRARPVPGSFFVLAHVAEHHPCTMRA